MRANLDGKLFLKFVSKLLSIFSLYNKEAILEGLLNKNLSDNEITKHIKGRADFKELNLTENKEYKGDGPDKVCKIIRFLKFSNVLGKYLH